MLVRKSPSSMALPENAHRDFFSFGCVWPIIFLTGFYIYFCHSAPRLAETTQVQSLYEPL